MEINYKTLEKELMREELSLTEEDEDVIRKEGEDIEPYFEDNDD